MRPRWLILGSILTIAVAAGAWAGYRAIESRQLRETIEQAKRDISAKRFTAARQRLDTIPAGWPERAEADYQLGLCELYRGRRDEAQAAWARVPSGTPVSALAAVQGAMLNMDRGRFTRTEEILRDALGRETGPGRDQLHRALELLYRMEGRTVDVRRVILESWKDAESPAAVVQNLYRLDTSPLPVEISRDVLTKVAPDDDRVRLGLANLAIRTGQLDEAARWLDSCLKAKPDDRAAWQSRLELAQAAGDVDGARQALGHLKVRDVSPAEALRVRAWLAGKLGNAKAEQSALSDLIAIEPGDIAALDRLTALAGEAGDAAESARLRIKRAEAGAAKERYRVLLKGSVSTGNAPELAQLAETLGRRIEAAGWALIRDGKAGEKRPREELIPGPEEEPAGKSQTLAELNADLLRGGSGPVRSLAASPGSPPQFADEAESSGLRFVQDNGQTPMKLLPETMSGGVGLLDYDGDGLLDVYAVQGGFFPPALNPTTGGVGDRLFRNRGDGTFEDVSGKAGIDAIPPGYGHGVAVGDYDNDGDPDLFVTRWRSYILLRNRGDGTFENATGPAGLGGDRDWPTSAAWADLDLDGDLDLYVCHYLAFDLASPRVCKDNGTGKTDYCSPREFESLPDHVFRNEAGKFVDITLASGFVDPHGRGLGVVAADLDDDNLIDLYVANDMSANYLFRNLGKSRFEETAVAAGAFANSSGGFQSGMGIACGDLDGDGRPDLAVTNYFGESTTFFRNMGKGLFADDTAAIGLAAPSRHMLGFGIAFFDANNDGRLDLITANGHVSDYRPAFPWKMPIQLFQGGAGGRLSDVSSRAGEPFRPLLLGRGLAVGDLDNDGRIDALVVPQNDPLVFLRNRSPGGHWLTIQLQGVRSNRDGVGARVVVEAGGTKRVAQRIGGGSYQSADDPRLHFGLGPADRVDRLEVRWPSGQVDRHEGLAADRLYRIREGDAAAKPIARRN